MTIRSDLVDKIGKIIADFQLALTTQDAGETLSPELAQVIELYTPMFPSMMERTSTIYRDDVLGLVAKYIQSDLTNERELTYLETLNLMAKTYDMGDKENRFAKDCLQVASKLRIAKYNEMRRKIEDEAKAKEREDMEAKRPTTADIVSTITIDGNKWIALVMMYNGTLHAYEPIKQGLITTYYPMSQFNQTDTSKSMKDFKHSDHVGLTFDDRAEIEDELRVQFERKASPDMRRVSMFVHAPARQRGHYHPDHVHMPFATNTKVFVKELIETPVGLFIKGVIYLEFGRNDEKGITHLFNLNEVNYHGVPID